MSTSFAVTSGGVRHVLWETKAKRHRPAVFSYSIRWGHRPSRKTGNVRCVREQGSFPCQPSMHVLFSRCFAESLTVTSFTRKQEKKLPLVHVLDVPGRFQQPPVRLIFCAAIPKYRQRLSFPPNATHDTRAHFRGRPQTLKRYHHVRRKTQRRIFGDGPRILKFPDSCPPNLRKFPKNASYCLTVLYQYSLRNSPRGKTLVSTIRLLPTKGQTEESPALQKS